MTDNPYEAPQCASYPKDSLRRSRLPAGIGYLFSSVCFVVIYMTTWLTFAPSHFRVPAWPAIAVPFVLSILAALRVQHSIVAPFICLLAIPSSSLLFALFRDWHLASFVFITVPISIILSIPSLIITLSRRRNCLRASRQSWVTNVVSLSE